MKFNHKFTNYKRRKYPECQICGLIGNSSVYNSSCIDPKKKPEIIKNLRDKIGREPNMAEISYEFSRLLE